MVSPYFAALQSGGLAGDMTRQRGRMGMLARRPRPMAPGPVPGMASAVQSAFPASFGLSKLPGLLRQQSPNDPAGGQGVIGPAPAPMGASRMIGAPALTKMMGGAPAAVSGRGSFETMAPAVQGSLMRSMQPQEAAVGPGGNGVFGNIARALAPRMGPKVAAPGPEAAVMPGSAPELSSFGGGFGGSFPTGGFTGRERRGPMYVR